MRPLMDLALVKAALCRALSADGSIPEWIEILPAGTVVEGRDGRRFTKTDPQAIVNAFKANGADLPLDWEHASEILAPEGQPAPAAGWIRELQARDDGSIWARVDWTPRGAESIKTREYRYVSPAIWSDPKHDNNIVGISTVALTNQPNLRITALNRTGASSSSEPATHQETAMDPKVLKALGLTDKATPDEVAAAIDALKAEKEKALNASQAPSLDKFVPRADYEAALNRAVTAEKAVTTQKQATLDAEIETEIKQAQAAGKITPSTADYHKAQCHTEGGLARFRDFVKAAPVVGEPTDLNSRKPAGDDGQQTPVMQAVSAQLGVSAETLKKYGTKA